MEEDELGELRAIGHRNYVTCSRCGSFVDRRTAAIVPGDALEENSEYSYICDACQRALADGEQDLPVVPD